MANRRPVPPPVPRFYRLQALRVREVSPTFRRVTVGGPALAEFSYLGFDHWFRLFVPEAGQTAWRLPTATSKLWYAQWLATPSRERPHCNNYTVRAFRPEAGELDIDVVLHRTTAGELEGRVAQWAVEVRPGDELAIFDEGLLFNPPSNADAVVLAGDETGLPAIEGILRSLDPPTRGLAVVEVPTRSDVRELAGPDGVEVHWVIRTEVDADAVPGTAALAALAAQPAPSPLAYAFLVGESGLATGGRRHLVRAGLSKDRITFCGFWKSSARHRSRAAAH